MDGAADVGAEDVVDELVLRDARQPGEGGGDDDRAEVVAAARQVGHLGAGVGDPGLDPGLQLVGRRHSPSSVATAILTEALDDSPHRERSPAT
ncbi:MAG: hypothetical protein AVDCRST_MAG30-1950 [uncultured Solirubrobacteraceae bacterium]|uniref:Uncharacterized protein n=1 Tax=uncultured Solirubrobacteraceae bacterium TaxID=1162706 RepID=A0A6J4SQ40_9ACTN|nr:MAG: hypothetical protein AVDCRST_MAG30-1950 [uncultured Solirubrobacteraceae bacterium]